jgi:Protein of unknown function (DUF2938)
MYLEPLYIGGVLFVGIGAALIMDFWNLFLQRAFHIPSLNFCLVGRWLSHMPLGTLTHARIAAASRRPAECVIGWTAHFLIAIAFSLMLVIGTSDGWLEDPSLFPALLVGVGTVLIPYFIVQPALGLGMASIKTPHPVQARLKSLMTHTVFGIGLYLSALLWRYLTHVSV